MAQKKKDKRNRKLEPGITQRKDGRYCYRKTEKGKKPICIYARSLDEIRAKIEKLSKMDWQEENVDSANITLDELAKVYFSKNKKNRSTTKQQYLIVFNKHISPKLGSKKINSLCSKDFRNLFEYLESEGLKRGNMERVKNVAVQIMSQAIAEEILADVSFVHAGWKAYSINIPPKKKEKVHALTMEEQEAFINYIKTKPRHKWLVPIVDVLIGTGMRCGECFALTWDDIDFEKNYIRINKTLVYYGVNDGKYGFAINPPKTDNGKRTIKMQSSVKDALLQLRDNPIFGQCKAVIDGYSGFVFGNDKQNVYIPYNINARLKTIVKTFNEEEKKKAELENRKPLQIKPFSLHCLRHTFATNVCRVTTDYKSVQSYLGHSDITVTMNTYVDATEEGKDKLIRLLEENYD